MIAKGTESSSRNLTDSRTGDVDELICRSLHGQATSSEEARLLAWRCASPENEGYYRHFVRLLDAVAAAEEDIPGDPPPLIEDLISPNSLRERIRGRFSWRGAVLLPGSMLTAAAIISLVVLGTSFTLPSVPQFGTGEVVTAKYEYSTVRLGDGTTVRLGPESRLRMAGDAGTREVWLEGRAFFAVAHDEARPFRIRSEGGDAVVLGTRFDLRARKDELRVVVVEGAVKIGEGEGEVQLAANEMGSIGKDREPRREQLEPEQIERELKWVGNFLAFENTPLTQVAQEVSALYAVPVHIMDTALVRETVRGVFVNESLEDVLAVLCRALSADCSVTPLGVTIGN
jgi:transmembrane sensor